MKIQQMVDEWNESVLVEDPKVDLETNISILNKLEFPQRVIDVVIDTDTYNEIDDQYALAYLLNSDDKLKLQAIYAAPFTAYKAKTPAEGMEASYKEIHRLLKLMGRKTEKAKVFRGATSYLENETVPIISEASKDLACRAMDYSEESPLYVIAIGAITNIASAILINPEITSRIVIVWLGGNALEWPQNNEFNMTQDINAARIVFGCGVALVQLPCMGVVSSFTVSGPELEKYLRGKNELCDYLLKITNEEAAACGSGSCWSRPIWDVTAVAWLLGENYMYDRIERVPIPEFDDRYAFSSNRHFYKYVYHINRDELLQDLIKKLTK